MQNKDEQPNNEASSSSCVASSSSAPARPPLKCTAIARHIAGEPIESWIEHAGFKFFSSPLGAAWVNQIERKVAEAPDNCAFVLLINGLKVHCRRAGANWCAVSCDRELSPVELSSLTHFLIYEKIPLAVVASAPKNYVTRIKAIRDDLAETTATMRDNLQKMLERGEGLTRILEHSEELQMESKRFYLSTTELNSCWPDWPWWLPSPSTITSLCEIL